MFDPPTRLMSYTYDPWMVPEAISCNNSSRHPQLQYNSINYSPYPPVPLSPYSSLANALDLTAVTGNLYKPTGHRRQNSHSHIESPLGHHVASSIYRSQAVAGSRHRDHVSKHHRHPSSPMVHFAMPDHPKPQLSLAPAPSSYVRLPQHKYSEPINPLFSYVDPSFRFPRIPFQLKCMPEPGVRVGDAVGGRTLLIEGSDDKVLNSCDREIKVKILWPGYEADFFERRFKTHRGTVTRESLLLLVAKMVIEFTEYIQRIFLLNGVMKCGLSVLIRMGKWASLVLRL